MSRHRDVRNMDYSEDYDGYDDIYGHSVDDDYYISPSNRQFIFNRENSRDQPKIAEFIRTEQDIQEEDETDLAMELSDLDKAKLESCLEQIKTNLVSVNIPRNELVNTIISHKFDMEKITNAVLTDARSLQSDRKDKDDTNKTSKFFIPKLNGFKGNVTLPFKNNDKPHVKQFNIPSLNMSKFGSPVSAPSSFTIPKINCFDQNKLELKAGESAKFNKLSDLVTNHLSKSFTTNLTINPTNREVHDIVESFDDLEIKRTELSELTSSNNFEIDLSAALKPTPSVQSISSKSKHNLKEDKFDIPFVDCDIDVETKVLLEYSFDAKDILNIYLQNTKQVSNFGKVLCRRYKIRHKKKVKHNSVLRNLPRFNFATPSPDDNIMKHLRS